MVSLPEFIVKAIEAKNTSLGNNGIFGDNTTYLTSKLLGERYKQVNRDIENILGYIPTTDEAKSLLSKTINKTMEIERPLRPQLEKLCEATVNTILGVPQETILLDCKLTDKIKPYGDIRILPEFDKEPIEYKFNNTEDNSTAKKEISKRRAINSMIQGISYLLMTATYDSEQLKEWSTELPTLYKYIIALNDFLLFAEEETITDENPMLGAYVETNISKQEEKTVIDSIGLVYPLLLQETYRGFFEAFATHGLPDNIEDARYVMRRADFTYAEAWDIRLGVPIWQDIDKMLDDNIEPNMYPYIFSSIAQLNPNEFNKTIQEIFNKDNNAKEWLENIIRQVKHDEEYNLFKKDIEKFNLEKCLITDTDDNKDEEIIENKI